jgi:hypothetical protein
VTISNLPSGKWTIDPGSTTGSSTTTVIGNLSPGTYSFAVTNAFGCVSPPSPNVVINKFVRDTTVITGVNDIKNGRVKVYPNPNHGSFTVDFGGAVSIRCQLVIYNIRGTEINTVWVGVGTNSMLVRTSTNHGTYIVVIKYNNAVLYSQKIIVMR